MKHFVQSYGNSKLNKLNLKDGVIEIKEETSIFNNHLDEILYFFQVTKYNVVIIEDLDRFGSPDIFLKLRELNQLLNESKIVGRNIVFVYAVKDDIFLNYNRENETCNFSKRNEQNFSFFASFFLWTFQPLKCKLNAD